jgi:erythromycin esterase
LWEVQLKSPVNRIQYQNPLSTVSACLRRVVPLLLASSALLCAQSAYLNLSFETSQGTAPAGWTQINGNYTHTVDTSTAVDGAQSLRIQSLTSDTTQYAYDLQTISADLAAGKTFQLSGFIRTQGVSGYADLWANVYDAQGNTVAFQDLGALTPTGTTAWQRYNFSVFVPATAAGINFGVLIAGTGTAWFDDLIIDVNGLNVYYPDPGPAQIQWIQANAIPFTSIDPSADLTELEPLKQVVGNAHVVGIGEDTHGTSEFFQMKARLASFLAQDMGFTVFAMEAGMPEAARINDYVLTGVGDPTELLKGLNNFPWNTQEMLNLVQWMRQYNASGKGQIQFFGFDMQDANVGMENVVRFVSQADPGLLASVNASYALIAPLDLPSGTNGSTNLAKYQAAQAAAQSVLDQLQANRAKYVQQMSATAVDWAIQNARIVEQAAEYGADGGGAANNTNPGFRDASMAANAEWIVAQMPPGSRIILSAHNGHINKAPGAMGGLLAQQFGQDYVTFGTAFHSGTYRAGANPITGTRDDIGVYPALTSFPGSAEYFFHQTGTPRQILDLRLANATDPGSAWLFGIVEFRAIGWEEEDGMTEFSPTEQLVPDFDGLIFFDQTNGATGFPNVAMDLTVLAPVTGPGGTLDVPYVEASAPGSGAPVALPAGTTGVPYAQTLSAGGGECALWPNILPACLTGTWPPYGSWTVTSGSPPPGLTLSTGGVLSGTPTQTGSFSFTVQTVDSTSQQTAQGQLELTINPTVLPGLRFVAVTPCRLADTRGASGPFGGPTLAGGTSRSFAIPQSACSIPSTAQAYSLNVTVVPQGPLPYLTLWPTGQDQPLVSTLNSFEGAVAANAALVPAGTDGAVSVYAAGPSDVILDINGYFDASTGPSSYSFYPATPCRVADTRGSAGPFGGPEMQGGESRDFAIPVSTCGMPFNAGAYSLNVTVVPDPAVDYLGYLSTWPAGQAQPLVSTLNSWTGKVVANAAIVPAGANGSISVFVSNPTNVILDTNGYFGAEGSAGALSFYPVTPCRVADTRNAVGPFGGPEMAASSTRSFAIPAAGCGIPATAAAYSVNVTVVPDSVLSYLTTWPAGQAQPLVSTLNSFDGTVVANAALVPAGANGAISVFVTNPTHVILDINGYFAP